jgi:hypothetical protein
MPYIHFTDQQKEQAAGVDLAAFLMSRGEKLIRSGRDMRLERDHSVTIRDNSWYDHAEEKGGGPISFVRRFYDLNYPDAVNLLLGGGGIAPPAAKKQVQEPPKEFVLPPVNGDARRVFAYLVKRRGIAPEVVRHFVQEGLLYEDAEYHNAVFVGTDEQGIPRHAHKRSTNSFGKVFRLNIEGGLPRYSFHHLGGDGTLFVFEAPIDMLSFITLNPEGWERHNYVACCGVSFIPVEKMLDRMPEVEEVFLCLDNDVAGHTASKRMAGLLAEKKIICERLTPQLKDWNDDLTMMKPKEVQRVCPTFGC